MLYADDVVVWCCFLYGEFAVHFCGSVFLVRFWFCYCSSDYFRSLSFVLFQSSHCCAYCCDCSSCCCRLFDLALALCFWLCFLICFSVFPCIHGCVVVALPEKHNIANNKPRKKRFCIEETSRSYTTRTSNQNKQEEEEGKKNNISYQFLPCVRFLKFHARLSSLFFDNMWNFEKAILCLVCWLMCYSYCCWLNVTVCLCLFLLIVVMLKVMVCCSVEFLVFCWHCRTVFQIFFQFCDVLSQTLDTVIPEAFLNLSSQPLPSKEAPCPKYLGSPIAPRPMP